MQIAQGEYTNMTIKEKIKNELADRINATQYEGFIELRMRKSNDVLIIWFDGAADDPETVYKLKSYKLQAVIVTGLDALAKEVMGYDKTVDRQQDLMAKLYDFQRQKINPGLATERERQWYANTFKRLFHYNPFCYA